MANKPRTVMTRHLVRNIVLLLLSMALAIAGLVVYRSVTAKKPAADSIVVPDEKPAEQTEEQTQSEEQVLSTLNIESARDAIRSYYSMLAAQDFAGLRSRGFDVAAGAVELGWVSQIGLEIHPESLMPDVDALPAPVSTYAGNELYAIRDFFTQAPANETVKSLITGQTGPVGWIYHDAMDDMWHIIDPTIPAGTQAPAASNQSRQSSDALVSVDMSSPGIFRNQWWAMTMMTVSVTSRASNYGVNVTARAFDSGISVMVPESLTVGISGSEVPTIPPTNPDGSLGIAQKTINGVCTIWRGSTTDFGVDRIGQSLMRMDGDDMSPVSVVANDEEVSPIFPVNNETAAATSKLLNEQQIEQYGLTGVVTVAGDAQQDQGEQAATESQETSAEGATTAQTATSMWSWAARPASGAVA